MVIGIQMPSYEFQLISKSGPLFILYFICPALKLEINKRLEVGGL
jgi:hypothetical protein